jgi:thiol-disulfide isomerase/thioredoxin
MHKLKFLTFLFFIIQIASVDGQTNNKDTSFYLTGMIKGRDTGLIVLWHTDLHNDMQSDTVKLDHGKFDVIGSINGACEALLWTDLKSTNRDAPSVVRFILEPGKIHIIYNTHDQENRIITGSKTQTEKDSWDKSKAILLKARQQASDSLAWVNNHPELPTFKASHDKWARKWDLLWDRMREEDVSYIIKHPHSWLSGYLLFHWERFIQLDSIERYFSDLPAAVKKSSIGYSILTYVYPLTNNNDFRKANPVFTTDFDDRLSKVKSLHDLNLMDSNGRTVSLGDLKGKYLVIDFWASWCKPCIENIPALNQLIRTYQPDQVAFVSISLDADANAWKKALVKYPCSTLQLADTIGFNSLTAIYCKALWVPHYVIADREGQIINYDAPQAIEPGLKNLLDKLLHSE